MTVSRSGEIDRPCSTVSSPVLTMPTVSAGSTTRDSARKEPSSADAAAQHGDHRVTAAVGQPAVERGEIGRAPRATRTRPVAWSAAASSRGRERRRRTPHWPGWWPERSTSSASHSRPAEPHTSGMLPAVAGHDRHTDLHRIEQREPEPLVERRIGQNRCVAQQPRARRLVDSPGHDDPPGHGRIQPVDRRVDRRPVVTVGARRAPAGSRRARRPTVRTPRPATGRFLRRSSVPIAAMYGRPTSAGTGGSAGVGAPGRRRAGWSPSRAPGNRSAISAAVDAELACTVAPRFDRPAQHSAGLVHVAAGQRRVAQEPAVVDRHHLRRRGMAARRSWCRARHRACRGIDRPAAGPRRAHSRWADQRRDRQPARRRLAAAIGTT